MQKFYLNYLVTSNNYISPYKSKQIYSSPKDDEIMTVKDDENGKTVRIVKKLRRSPILINEERHTNPQIKTYQRNFSDIQKPEKEKPKERARIGKREYENTAHFPGRGLSALRRINQKIEKYRQMNNERKRRSTQNENSLSHLIKTKNKQDKNISNFPDTNRSVHFNFIDNM